jgi:hypothetical protein
MEIGHCNDVMCVDIVEGCCAGGVELRELADCRVKWSWRVEMSEGPTCTAWLGEEQGTRRIAGADCYNTPRRDTKPAKLPRPVTISNGGANDEGTTVSQVRSASPGFKTIKP